MTGETITEAYRDQYRRMYADPGVTYGVRGYLWVRPAAAFLRTLGPGQRGVTRLVDYGCGRGTLADALEERGFIVTRYEPGIPDYAGDPMPAEAVVSTDVLEHVEPELVDNALAHVRRLGPRGAFLVIATREAKRRLPDGSSPHRTVRPGSWWLDKLRAHYDVVHTAPGTSQGQLVAECWNV